jgi:class I fructose-bisphosphate aldolase
MKKTISDVVRGGANAVLMHKGLVRCGHRQSGRDVGLAIHLSASTSLSPTPNHKVLVSGVEDAIRLGADAVSVHVNLGDPSESVMLQDLGRIASEAGNWGVPVLAMVYARGPKIENEFDPDTVAHCARVGEELGADVVKVPYTGDPESFSRVVDGCCIPVVIAGGPKKDSTRDFLQMIQESCEAGGAGLSVGRNIFQHENPAALVRALDAIVHQGVAAEEAAAMMEQ